MKTTVMLALLAILILIIALPACAVQDEFSKPPTATVKTPPPPQKNDRILIAVAPQTIQENWADRILGIIPLIRKNDMNVIAMENERYEEWKELYIKAVHSLKKDQQLNWSKLQVNGESPRYYLEVVYSEQPQWQARDTSFNSGELQNLFQSDWNRFCGWYEANFADSELQVKVSMRATLRDVRTYKQVQDDKQRVVTFEASGEASNRSTYLLGFSQSKYRSPDTILDAACKKAVEALARDIAKEVKGLAL